MNEQLKRHNIAHLWDSNLIREQLTKLATRVTRQQQIAGKPLNSFHITVSPMGP